MKIKIVAKFCPFSRICGSSVIIPKTSTEVKIFPTKLEFYNKENNVDSLEINLDIGQLDKFFVFQNLEKFHIEVSGFLKEGFLRYVIFAKENKIFIEIKKAPFKKVIFLIKNKKFSFDIKKKFLLPIKTEYIEPNLIEKLSLGMHKKQDVELIQRREDIKEIFPIWFVLGQLVPLKKEKYEGVASLLKKEVKKEALENLFIDIYKAGFRSIFVPMLFDDRFQGIISSKQKISKTASSLILLKKGYEHIRKLFFYEQKKVIEILPCLLPSFHSGRLINIKSDIGIIDIEWSKKLLKKMILHTKKDDKIRLKLQSKIKTFRLRKNVKEKGKYYKASDLLEIRKNRTYFLDRFQK